MTLVNDLFRIALRLFLLAVGVAFVAGMLALLLAFATLWALRALWAKLTGQAITPWVMRVDPRAGWSRFTQPRSSQRTPSADFTTGEASPRAARHKLAGVGDVVDVEVKEHR